MCGMRVAIKAQAVVGQVTTPGEEANLLDHGPVTPVTCTVTDDSLSREEQRERRRARARAQRMVEEAKQRAVMQEAHFLAGTLSPFQLAVVLGCLLIYLLSPPTSTSPFPFSLHLRFSFCFPLPPPASPFRSECSHLYLCFNFILVCWCYCGRDGIAETSESSKYLQTARLFH